MAAEQNIAIVAVDPAYTSRWGAQHWQKPLTTPRRRPSRHDAASVAVGRRALGHPIRRRTTPPHDDQSDRRGHGPVQARPETRRREEVTAYPAAPPDARRRTVERKRATRVPTTVRDTQLSTSSGNRTHSRSSRNGVRLFRPWGATERRNRGLGHPLPRTPCPPPSSAMSRFYRSRHCTSAVSSSGQSPGDSASRTSAEHRHLHRYGSSASLRESTTRKRQAITTHSTMTIVPLRHETEKHTIGRYSGCIDFDLGP
ncbi:hypothetical protein SALBM311S_06009 [Streptomyces alboniger]